MDNPETEVCFYEFKTSLGNRIRLCKVANFKYIRVKLEAVITNPEDVKLLERELDVVKAVTRLLTWKHIGW
ncbi:hypothetical protein J7M00_06855 [bacterium]|nr:hypothetical protein [bacterium]